VSQISIYIISVAFANESSMRAIVYDVKTSLKY